MLLQEPPESAYDLRFQLFRWPIRVAWGFWVMAIVLGYAWIQGLDRSPESPGFVPLLVLWAGAVLVSVLIHEMGHAAAFRQAGIDSEIVLYHFGGLAIPRVTDRTYGALSPGQHLWISLAGPLVQLVSAVLLIAAVKAAGYRLDQFNTMIQLPAWVLTALHGGQGEWLVPNRFALYAVIDFYLFPSIFWAVLNLIPVLPLDGGRISYSLVQLRGGDVRQALWISVIASGLVAIYALTHGQTYLGIMFLALGINAFQQLNPSRGWS